MGEEASSSGGKHGTRSTVRVLYVSKTLSGNLQDSAVSWKKLYFSQKEILIKHKI